MHPGGKELPSTTIQKEINIRKQKFGKKESDGEVCFLNNTIFILGSSILLKEYFFYF